MMTNTEILARLRGRLQGVNERILAACGRADRSRTEITLVAVTKTVGDRVAGLLPELGVTNLGENRPQELWRKAEVLKGLPIRWHMIGHLQRNKVERTLPLVQLTHAVDSERLLEEIDSQAKKRGVSAPVLLEVNVSRESNKLGFAPGEVASVLAKLDRFTHVEVQGLMTMAAYSEDPEQARPGFKELFQLRQFAQLPQLSMGMSNDFEIAVEEGATLIRLGTVLFEGLEEVD
jgi:pyridoxal phosphate enzyme (YggS family)